ncbi:organic cation transporter protein-like isoform X1 [Asterias rubens]|uniref:organic cation transporter protein-like isoform X1 n=1 Tax=Asterias rubens TaxID=7604 RepID=UPI0014558F95|nr:organic cation transporter protein-like isoform X1 [Asterias rubens]
MELDQVLVFLGDFGRFQTLVYILICLAGQVPSAWHMLAISFLGAVPDYRCDAPPGDQPEETAVRESGSGSLKISSQCEQYVNVSVDNTTEPCGDGWVYDSTYGNTIVTEWDLVCGKDASVELSQTVFMTGVMVGSLLFGHLSDRYGRRPVFFLSLWAQVAFGVGVALTGNLYGFMAVRFFVGVIEQGVDITSYVMVTEMFSPSRRAFAGILLTLFWASGIMSLSGLAYLLRDWRHLQLAITLPSLLTIPLWWIIPESARWLMSRGRVKEAEAILHRIARFNRVPLPDNVLSTNEQSSGSSKVSTERALENKGFQPGDVAEKPLGLDETPDGVEEGALKERVRGHTAKITHDHHAGKPELFTLWHLFSTPGMRRISIVMIFAWFVNSLVYYGLSLNTSSLAGDPYLNFFLSGAVEIPAYLVSTAVVTWFGRRLPLCVFHVFGGVACIATAFIPEMTESGTDLTALIVTTAMLGKFGIAGSYAIVFLYASELYPTVVRNLGIGLSSFASRVGGVLAPIIMYLGKVIGWVPMVIFGGLSVLAGLSVLVLHETLGKKQPQTLEDVEKTKYRVEEERSG